MDAVDAKFDAKGFGRAARCELALQPAGSVAKRWASLCSDLRRRLNIKRAHVFCFSCAKIQDFQ